MEMMMKCAVFVASLLLMAQSNPDASDQSGGGCKGKTLIVFLDESFVRDADYFTFPDTYVKLTIGNLTKRSEVVTNNQTAVFHQSLVFPNPEGNVLEIEVWDEDYWFDEDDLMGACQIDLQKPSSEEECKFDNGDVSLSYTCV